MNKIWNFSIVASILLLPVNPVRAFHFYTAQISGEGIAASEISVPPASTVVPESQPQPQPPSSLPPPPPPPPPLPLPPPSLPPPPSLSVTEEFDEEPMGHFVDPQEVKRVVREIKSNFFRDIKQLRKGAQKTGLKDAVVLIDKLNAGANEILAVLSNSNSDNSAWREALDRWYRGDENDGENYWEQMNRRIRPQVELPKEVRDGLKSIMRLEKLLASKQIQKVAQNLSLNLSGAGQYASEAKRVLQKVNGFLAGGNYEEAMEEMQGFRDNESPHPGEVEGATQRFRGTSDMLRGIKDPNVITQFKSLVQPAVAAYNEGDYREVHELMSEVEREMMKLMNSAYRRKRPSQPAMPQPAAPASLFHILRRFLR